MDKKFNKINGSIGENQAIQYLKKKKYQILAQNYKTRIGEIDIICKNKECIVFVEVKMRESCQFGRPCEAVNMHKQHKIRRVAEEYLIRSHIADTPIRFDVIEVLGDEINHIENCF
ncbi:MAG: YraN family protein [Clostridia bacterium]|nr:YraN family protein [Clostridia bacterium]MBQ8792055.1 YraN family protein [Clostridia bacterium]